LIGTVSAALVDKSAALVEPLDFLLLSRLAAKDISPSYQCAVPLAGAVVSQEEVYTEEHVKLLGDYKEPW
jgi:hypothetical protein